MRTVEGALAGKVAIVTGWSGNLGKAIAFGFASAGARLWLVDRAESEGSRELVESLGEAVLGAVKLDITDEKAVEKFYRDKVSPDPLDILVNNAGKGVFSDWKGRTLSQFMSVMEVNAGGTFLMTREAINQMEVRKTGSVINIGSIYGTVSSDPNLYGDGDRKNSEAYSASKAAVAQLSKYFAVHAAASGIRVNTVSPGGIENALHSVSFSARYRQRNPMGRFATVSDVVPLVVFLASDLSTYISGQNVHVDGGFTAW